MLDTKKYREYFGWAICAPEKNDETRPDNSLDAKSRKGIHPGEGSLERDLFFSR